jgi:hypothetical protein
MDQTTARTATDNSRLIGALAAVAALAAGALSNFGNLSEKAGEDGGTGPFLVGAGVALVLTAVLFLRVVPRSQGSTRTALIVAVVAVLSLAGYWAGLPEVFGPAAIVVALSGRRSAGTVFAVVLATGAVLAGVLAALLG